MTATRERAELFWRMSVPISALLLVLLAIPLSYVNPRMGRSFNLVAAAFLYMLYSNCLNIVQSFIAQGRISLLAGALIIHTVAAVVVVLLFRNQLSVTGLFRLRSRHSRMKTLTRYIGREVLYAILLIFGALLMLFAFFDLIHELGDVGKDGYTSGRALLFVALQCSVATVRTLSGRGADRHAVRDGATRRQFGIHGDARVGRIADAGHSGRSCASACRWRSRRFSPANSSRRRPSDSRSRFACRRRDRRTGSSRSSSQSGFWFKQDQTFVNIRSVLSDMTLLGVRIYEFDRDLRLKSRARRRFGQLRRRRALAPGQRDHDHVLGRRRDARASRQGRIWQRC